MVETSRDWSEKLPFTLWAYRTSFRTSTEPHLLIGVWYGGMLPVEIEMGSLRWKPILGATNVDQLKRSPLVYARIVWESHESWTYRAPGHCPSIITFIADVTSLHVGFERIIIALCVICLTIILVFAFDSSFLFHPLFMPYNDPFRVFEPSFPSFLLPYYPSLRYVSCLKTTLRPWDQMSSSTALLGLAFETWIARLIMDDFMSPDFRSTTHLCHTGHISVSVESYRSSWSYMITPTFGMRTEMRTCSLFYHDPSVEPLLSHLVIMFNIFEGCLFTLMVTVSMMFCQDEPSTEHDLREHPLRLMESILDHFHGLRAVVACYTEPHIQIGVQSRIFNLAFRSVFSFWAFDDTITSRATISSQFRHSEPSSFSVSAFRAIIILVLTFRAIIILDFDSHHRSQFWRSKPSSLLSFGIQSHHRFFSSTFRAIIASLVRRSESSSFSISTFRAIIASSVLVFRATISSQFGHFGPPSLYSLAFRAIIVSVSAFRVIIASQAIIILNFGFQSHHRFSVSTFRAIIASQFRRSEPSSFSVLAFRAIIILNFGVQSHHRFFSFGVQSHHLFSVWAFWATIFLQLGIQNHHRSQFQCSGPSSFLSFGIKSHHHSQFQRSEPSSFSFRRLEPSSFSFRHSEPSSLLSFGVQVIIAFQLRCSKPSAFSIRRSEPSQFSVSAFRVIITSQFWHLEPSSLLQFGIQSHISSSTFKVTIPAPFDAQSLHILQFERSELPSLYSLAFRTTFISLTFRVVFRAIVHIQAFRAIVHIQVFGAIVHIQAFRAIIFPYFGI
ncbi:hypothetical protein CK203_055363 [Vitis vinifera]|uniref:Uncharacterized protein n=1 Tax=Vitis vinifera TaxID=29760 RepID=A0A438GSX3_VITVI|nr:hypothetical protein CK203_055363 [Vitis vinifera]